MFIVVNVQSYAGVYSAPFVPIRNIFDNKVIVLIVVVTRDPIYLPIVQVSYNKLTRGRYNLCPLFGIIVISGSSLYASAAHFRHVRFSYVARVTEDENVDGDNGEDYVRAFHGASLGEEI